MYDFLTKEFLTKELEEKTVTRLSEEIGCAKRTIYSRCKKYGINVSKNKHSKEHNNLVNKIFGNLTVIELGTPDAHGKRRWLCECSCGTRKLINAASLKRGLSKSCGKCLIGNPQFTGYKDISGSWFRRLKDSADKRGLVFDISCKDVYDIWIKQNKKCVLTNVDIFFNRNQDTSIQTASLDRIDNSIGYIISNLQVIHKRVNRIKSVLSNEEFIFWCHLVANNCANLHSFEVENIKWTDGQRN